ncbi:MAG: FHA domain-containing protein [Myxococcales bacterium]
MSLDEEVDPVQQPDEAQALEAYRAEWQRDLDSFRKLHGRAFLLRRRSGAHQELEAPKTGRRTLIQRVPTAAFQELPPSKYLVFPVRKTERSTIARFYSVGTTRNNDIVVRDASVSKFHAFFQDTEDERIFVLQDARSTNGTFVNGEPVPPQGQGDPLKVRSGDRVRFGNVELTLMDAEEFLALLQEVYG